MSGVSREQLRSVHERERERFSELRPRGTQLLERAAKNMPNGVPQTWMATLYEHPPIVVKGGSGSRT